MIPVADEIDGVDDVAATSSPPLVHKTTPCSVPLLQKLSPRRIWVNNNNKKNNNMQDASSSSSCNSSNSSSRRHFVGNNTTSSSLLFTKNTSINHKTTRLLLSCVFHWFISVSLSIIILIAVPLSFYDITSVLQQEERTTTISAIRLIKQILIGWTSLLHISAWLLLVIISIVGLFLAQQKYNCILSPDTYGSSSSNGDGFSSSCQNCISVTGHHHHHNNHNSGSCINNRRSTCALSCCSSSSSSSSSSSCRTSNNQIRSSSNRVFPLSAVAVTTIGLGFILAVTIALQSNLQMIHPSWVWNPFLWGGYRVYRPNKINQAMEGICIEDYYDRSHHHYEEPGAAATTNIMNKFSDISKTIELKTKIRRGGGQDGEGDGSHHEMPLCLKESQWNELSTEALSSKNQKDVNMVLKGLHYAKVQSGGILISVMSRDTVHAIQPLRDNVEGLLPLVSELSVVVFENDSIDGSRDEFYKWSNSTNDLYNVDIIECEIPNCRYNEHHRDFVSSSVALSSHEEKDDGISNNDDHNKDVTIPYAKTSAIGRMAEFRNRMVKHILEHPRYVNYTHMIVLDIDLGVSLSPLGVLHTLGSYPKNPVASSGRQVWPGSFGTITPPYDFSAFQAHETNENKRLISLHEKFCNLKPKGDRWRNECNAVSPMFTMIVLGEDRLRSGRDAEPYVVDSAFNGATIYPLNLIRTSNAQYDVGEDGQRCEHIGFNLSLNNTMYVNPKWSMHVSPNAPGGPTGKRASQTIQGIASSPLIGPIIFFQNMFCMVLFVYAIITLSMKVLYFFWIKIAFGIYFVDIIMTSCGVVNENQFLLVRAKQRKSDVSSSQSMNATTTATTPSDLESLLSCDLQLSPRKRKVSDFDSSFCSGGVGGSGIVVTTTKR